jgi:hypothetical protein
MIREESAKLLASLESDLRTLKWKKASTQQVQATR